MPKCKGKNSVKLMRLKKITWDVGVNNSEPIKPSVLCSCYTLLDSLKNIFLLKGLREYKSGTCSVESVRQGVI